MRVRCYDRYAESVSFDVYDLLDLGAMLSFSTPPYVAMRFDIGPKILSNPFDICTLIGDSIVAKKILKNCYISISHRITQVNLVEIGMSNFDIILRIDWFTLCFYRL